MPTYSLTKRCAADLKEIAAFTVERWGEAQVDTYVGGLEALFQIVAGRPMMGRSAGHVAPHLRRVEHVSHIVFYKAMAGGIRIVRVLHKSRALKTRYFVGK